MYTAYFFFDWALYPRRSPPRVSSATATSEIRPLTPALPHHTSHDQHSPRGLYPRAGFIPFQSPQGFVGSGKKREGGTPRPLPPLTPPLFSHKTLPFQCPNMLKIHHK